MHNRIPDGVKFFLKSYLMPYSRILLIAAVVFVGNIAHAAEQNAVLDNTEVMDLNPVEVADVVNAVGPYTTNYQEDSVQVALAMKNEEYIGKPVIMETAKTEQPKADENRKSTIAYTVQAGDTISSIGWKFGLKLATIKTLNNLSSDIIKEGQTLKLPPADLSPTYIAQLAAQKKQRVAGSSTQVPFAGKFRRPTSGWDMSQGFGRTSFEKFHDGVDLTSRSGTTLYASASGRVIKTTRGWGGGYGNYIVIDHGDGWQTLYGHMSTFSVSSGQWVNQGQVIGIMGNSGWSTGVHVHFKITRYGKVLNPLNYL